MAAARILRVDPFTPDASSWNAAIAEAKAILAAGGLVAIPTETVYGLAADALSDDAVRAIFAAKGRPATNPLIVHASDVAQARSLVSAWPDEAEALARAFWPGPLTIVVPKGPSIPSAVTAGGETVALRVPAHAVARALIAGFGPLAAPSANRSNAISPTTAAHVARGLGDRIDLILDAGPTAGGIESTVVQIAGTVRLLRPGLVTPSEIEAVVGPIVRGADPKAAVAASPGLLARHYAPRARVEVTTDDRARVEELAKGARVGWLSLGATNGPSGAIVIPMSNDPSAYAARLYAALHELDAHGVEVIVVAAPPDDDAWLGVRDRLARASA